MTSSRRAELLLLSITVVWGSTFVITKNLIETNSPYFYTGIRFLLSALLIFLPFMKRCSFIARETWKHGTILGVILFAGFVLQTIGIVYTTASKAAFFTGMLVPLTPVVHFIGQKFFNIKKRTLRVGNIVGVICAAVGLYMLTSPAGSGFNLGDFLNLACALCFACFIVYLDTVPAETDKIAMTYAQFLICGLIGFFTALLFEEIRVSYSGETLAGFLYLVIFATVITMWIQNRYQGDTTPTRAAVIFAMEPVVAAIFGNYVRGENIGLVGVIGGGIILAGLILSEFSEELPVLRNSINKSGPDFKNV